MLSLSQHLDKWILNQVRVVCGIQLGGTLAETVAERDGLLRAIGSVVQARMSGGEQRKRWKEGVDSFMSADFERARRNFEDAVCAENKVGGAPNLYEDHSERQLLPTQFLFALGETLQAQGKQRQCLYLYENVVRARCDGAMHEFASEKMNGQAIVCGEFAHYAYPRLLLADLMAECGTLCSYTAHRQRNVKVAPLHFERARSLITNVAQQFDTLRRSNSFVSEAFIQPDSRDDGGGEEPAVDFETVDTCEIMAARAWRHESNAMDSDEARAAIAGLSRRVSTSLFSYRARYGVHMDSRGQFGDADRHHRRVFLAYDAAPLPLHLHPLFGTLLNPMSRNSFGLDVTTEEATRDNDQAAAVRQHIEAVLKRASASLNAHLTELGSSHAATIEAKLNAAWIHRCVGGDSHRALAVQLAEQAVSDVMARCGGANHPHVVAAHCHLALALLDVGDHQRALSVCTDAVRAARACSRPPHHTIVHLAALHTLALVTGIDTELRNDALSLISSTDQLLMFGRLGERNVDNYTTLTFDARTPSCAAKQTHPLRTEMLSAANFVEVNAENADKRALQAMLNSMKVKK